MVNPILSHSQEPVQPVSQPKSTDPTTAGAIASMHTDKDKEKAVASKFSSLDALRKADPETYNQMMKSLMLTVLSDLRKHEQRRANAARALKDE